MGLTAIFLLGALALTGALLRMMGMPFDYVALTVVALLFLALASILAVMQIQENRTRRWLEKKWFPNQAAQRFKPVPWYRRRPYLSALGLLALATLVAVPVLLLRSQSPAPTVARTAPAQPSVSVASVSSVAANSTATATADTAVAPTVTAPVPAPAVSAAASAALAPVANTPPADMRAAVQAVVQAWAQAWSAGNAEAYLSHYSASFKPATHQTRSAWERTRRERVTPEQQIRVDLDALELVSWGDNQAQVRFVQRYAAKRLQDKSRKQLDLVLENGQWKIATETVLATLTP
jgi:hypothetical protein